MVRPASHIYASNGEYKAAEVSAGLDSDKLGTLKHLFPNGKKRGHNFEVGDLHGNAGDSLKVNLNGSKGTVWKDFATGEVGADLLDLWAQARCGGDIGKAKAEAEAYLGLRKQRKRLRRRLSLSRNQNPRWSLSLPSRSMRRRNRNSTPF